MDELVAALEKLGCDVEDTAELTLFECPACKNPNEKLAKEDPPRRCDFCGHEQENPFESLGTTSVIRLDLLADRPDLFDAGGLARALKGSLDIETGLAQFATIASDRELVVDPSVKNPQSLRPYIACAVIKLPPLNQITLREVMKLQENLHWGIGRDRKLASIGVYDLDTIAFPVHYTTVDPDAFNFCPLGNPGQAMTPRQILAGHPKGMAYAHLLTGLSRYPLLTDAHNQVLSMPPIINSEETKCSIGTSRIFIDVTGLTAGAVSHSLAAMVAALVEIGGTIEQVKISDGRESIMTPDMTPKTIEIDFNAACQWLGISFERTEFMATLQRARFAVEQMPGSQFRVSYPVFRQDVRHQVDIFEDLAIGYGFDRIKPRLIPTMTVGRERPEELISAMARSVMTGLGFSEIMTLNLQSLERHFEKLEIAAENNHVVVANPKTIEQKVLRTHLMTGLLETLHKNKRRPLPLRLFEIGNVVSIDDSAETGVEESRHLGAIMIGPECGFTDARAALDALLFEMGAKATYREVEHSSFIAGRVAEIESGKFWARAGEIQPQVLNNFGLIFPVAYFEIRLARIF